MRLGRPHIVAGGRGRAAGNAQAEVQQNATLACLQRIKMTEMASRFPRSHLKLGRSSMTLSGRVRGVILLGVAALAWPAKPQAPANARPFLDAGVSDLKRGDLHAAERELLEAANLDPGNPQTYNLLGFICDQTGRSDQSVRYYERALTLAPTFSAARNNLGNVYLREGKTSLAIEQFQQTLPLRPDDLTANLARPISNWEIVNENKAKRGLSKEGLRTKVTGRPISSGALASARFVLHQNLNGVLTGQRGSPVCKGDRRPDGGRWPDSSIPQTYCVCVRPS